MLASADELVQLFDLRTAELMERAASGSRWLKPPPPPTRLSATAATGPAIGAGPTSG